MTEKANHPNVIRIPFKEVIDFMAQPNRPEGTEKYIYVWGRELLRKNYPNGIIAEIDSKAQEYIIRPA
jgi:hypothetical protein